MPREQINPVNVRRMKATASLQQLSSDIEMARMEYLRATGWEYTCKTPGSFWVWTREYNGQLLMAREGLAISMQEAIDDAD